MTSRSVRRMHKEYLKAPTQPRFMKILRANERLAADHSIDQHIIRGLNSALRNEKKRRQRGKRLNLLGDGDSGPQFFSPSKVQAARDRLEAKEMERTQKQQELEGKKALTAAAKKQKEDDKAQRSKIATEKKILSAELREKKLAEKQVQKDLKNTASEIGEGSSSSIKVYPAPFLPEKVGKTKQSKVGTTMGVDKVKTVNLVTARGRQVQKPKRFD